MTLPQAHLEPKGLRSKGSKRAFPLAEPYDDVACYDDLALDAKQSIRVLDWLDVEGSPRWFPRNSRTYCNVYASDAARVLGMYIPRVWWDRNALKKLRAGEKLRAIYPGKNTKGTIREMSANSIHDWFVEFGAEFGWSVETATSRDNRADLARQLRATLNEVGSFGVICARRSDRNRSGHIVLAFPDAVGPKIHQSDRSFPVQSQAGTRNRQTFSTDWFLGSQFDSVAFVSIQRLEEDSL